MCGENSGETSHPSAEPGSPPHVRGKHLNEMIKSLCLRITPACAGKTKHLIAAVYLTWDHPRMCGENTASTVVCSSRTGSPPHVRGKRPQIPAVFRCRGITPACAGKTNSGYGWNGGAWDHPRMCGENHGANVLHALNPGSPPHVRGKRSLSQIASVGRKITPACAGKTSGICRGCRCCRDHPRMCGENHLSQSGNFSGPGSPPHVRGKLVHPEERNKTIGITPACAGKTCATPCPTCNGGDHPRMCGENSVHVCMFSPMRGSPPHVRGKP